MITEVLQEDVRVLANVAEVDTLATALEEEQSIKVFEEGGIWLMDSAQNRLASSSQLSQESNNVESTLGVETRCGLIQEQ
jgi:hypothetical protein